MRERFQAKNPRSLMLRFHTQTAGSTLTAQQPLNNIVRVTLQALSAVLGGTQSLHTNSFDEAVSLPTESAASLALRTQQILAYETGVTDVVDPMAGSYYLENLTDRMEEAILAQMKEIEGMGGALKAVEKGYFSNQIAKSAYNYQKQQEQGEKIVVGVNKFVEPEKEHPPLLQINPALEEKQKNRLSKLRAERDNQAVARLLSSISKAGEKGLPLMPLFVEGAEKLVTLGEMADALRKVWGEFDRS
jgi:methylmalonyl-CoA mutase N-terminal domain/subunit